MTNQGDRCEADIWHSSHLFCRSVCWTEVMNWNTQHGWKSICGEIKCSDMQDSRWRYHQKYPILGFFSPKLCQVRQRLVVKVGPRHVFTFMTKILDPHRSWHPFLWEDKNTAWQAQQTDCRMLPKPTWQLTVDLCRRRSCSWNSCPFVLFVALFLASLWVVCGWKMFARKVSRFRICLEKYQFSRAFLWFFANKYMPIDHPAWQK